MQRIDDQDRRLLRQLQAGGVQAMSEVAARAGLGAGAAARRLERLEKSGVIKGYEAVIDWRALGYQIEVSLRVALDKTHTKAFDEFIGAAREIPQVYEIQTFLGRVDVRLNVLARDLQHYQDIYRRKILALPHIADIEALMLIGDLHSGESLPL